MSMKSTKKMEELEAYALQTGHTKYAEQKRNAMPFPYNAFCFVWEVEERK